MPGKLALQYPKIVAFAPRLPVRGRAAALLPAAVSDNIFQRPVDYAGPRFFGQKSFLLGYWFGFGHYACGFFWIANALMLDLPRLGWLIPLFFVGSGGFFGLFTAFPALFCSRFKPFGPSCRPLPRHGPFLSGCGVLF